MKAVLVALILCVLSCTPPSLYEASIKGHKLQLEVVTTAALRSKGLMFRRTLKKNHGMLFVYPFAAQRSFWMKNTYIPLSIAYIDQFGTILEVYDMDPVDESGNYKIYPSKKPMQMALEVNYGWFRTHGLGPGDSLHIPRGGVQRVIQKSSY